MRSRLAGANGLAQQDSRRHAPAAGCPRASRSCGCAISTSGRLEFASGAPNLALSSGAALLPVFVVRLGSNAFEVVVEPPLEPAAGLERHAAVDDVLGRYAALLESYIRRHPNQWSGWYRLEMEPRAAEGEAAG